MFGNIFNGNSFDGIELTNTILSLPKVDRQLATLFPWGVTTSLRPEVALDKDGWTIRVVPSTPRDGVAPLRKRTRRSTHMIEIPGYAERDTIRNSSLLGVRETGTTAVKTIEGERNKSLAQMDADLDETEEHQRAQALDGIITDIDGNLIADMYEILGEEQVEKELDLTLPNKEIDDQLIELKQASEDFLGGIKAERYILLQGRKHSNATLRQRAVKEQAQNPTNVLLQRQDNRQGVRIVNDVDIIAYSGQHIDENMSYFIPIYPDMCRTIYGPSEVDEYWGNVLPRYVTRELIKHGKGVEMEVWSYFINFFTRPGSIIKIPNLTVEGGL